MKKNMHKVLLCDSISPIVTEIFKKNGLDVINKPGLNQDELIQELNGVSAAIIRSSTTLNAEILEKAPSLKVIGRAGIGIDNIDIKKASERGVIVMNTPFANTVTTAEHSISMLMAASRSIPEAAASVLKGEWKRSAFKGVELMDKTLGVIGCGNIGRLVVERAIALKMRVIVYDPFLSSSAISELGAEAVNFSELLQRSDSISLHVPLIEKTKNLIDKTAFSQMKKGVIFINCARGGIVDERALAENLISGQVRAAALDVFSKEPIDLGNPLMKAPNVILTPHLGAATEEAQERVASQIAWQVSNYLLHGEIRNAVNTVSISASEQKKLQPYLNLVFKLSHFLAVITKAPLLSISIQFWGEATGLPSELLEAETLRGFLSSTVDNINIINARSIAENRKVKIQLIKNNEENEFHNLIQLSLKTEENVHEISGTVFAGHPKIVSLQNRNIQAEIRQYNLYVMNKDEPGFIGDLAGKLAEHKINIASFHLSRFSLSHTDSHEAVALLILDSPLSAELLNEIKLLDKIIDAKYIAFEN